MADHARGGGRGRGGSRRGQPARRTASSRGVGRDSPLGNGSGDAAAAARQREQALLVGTSSFTGPAVWEHDLVFRRIADHVATVVRSSAVGGGELAERLANLSRAGSTGAAGAGATSLGVADAATAEARAVRRLARAFQSMLHSSRGDAHSYLAFTLSDAYACLNRWRQCATVREGAARAAGAAAGAADDGTAHSLPQTAGDAEENDVERQVGPTDDSDGDGAGEGSGVRGGGSAGIEALAAGSPWMDDDDVRTVLVCERLLEALTCVAALALSVEHIVRLLEPLDKHAAFWKGRVEWPARDFLESGPRMWWRATVQAVSRMAEDERARRGSVKPSEGGDEGTGDSDVAAGEAAVPGPSPHQAWWTPFNPRPASLAKVVSIELLRKPLLFRLGMVQRALLTFKAASHPRDMQLAVANAVTTLREVMLPPDSPRIGGDSRLDELFALLATEEAAAGPEVTGLQWLDDKMEASITPLRMRNFWERNWWRITLFGIGIAAVGIKMIRNRDKLREWRDKAYTSLKDFMNEHVVAPSRAIYDELFHSERLHVANEESLEDATQSLRTMLRDFAAHSHPPMSEEQVQQVANSLDITFVSRKYEQEIQHPLYNAVRGDLVQMMLIQIQSIKHELMVAMEAVDQLLRENEFNLQVMATVPAFMVLAGSFVMVRGLWRKITRPTSTRQLRSMMRMTLRDVDRLLTLSGGNPRDDVAAMVSRRFSQALRQSAAGTGWGASVASRSSRHRSRGEGQGAQFRGLAPSELGTLMYLVIQFKNLLDRYRAHSVMTLSEWVRLNEDLRDLSSYELSPAQRTQTLARMRSTHGFLLPDRPAQAFLN